MIGSFTSGPASRDGKMASLFGSKILARILRLNATNFTSWLTSSSLTLTSKTSDSSFSIRTPRMKLKATIKILDKTTGAKRVVSQSWVADLKRKQVTCLCP